MRCPSLAWPALFAALLAACTPTFNWREIRVPGAGLTALLPCKPDQGTRAVAIGPRTLQLSMQGCEAAGATFAVAWADAGDAAGANAVLAQWQAMAQANMQAGPARTEPFRPPGAAPLAASVRMAAAGRQTDGRPVEMRSVWFARGSHVFQAVIYAPRIPEEAAEAFFAGLRLS